MIGALSVRRLKTAEGSTLVEFSLVAFMLIIVILGVVEMGRLVLVYTTIANSARAGARYAIVHGHDRAAGSGADGESGPGNNPAQVLTVVKNFGSAGLLHLSDSNITVTYSPSNTVGSTVTVKVVYTYDPLVSFFNNLLNVNLGSTSQGVITY
jgi:Flp pilus assembly protein TadG